MNISIIIPAYNAAETIRDTLESVLAQTYSAWEAIVIDDGSDDHTAEVVNPFLERDARIRMVRQKRGGESAARNAGIAAARYQWLLFLDADDWIAPQHLERLTSELASNPEHDAVHCGYARVARDGTQVVEKYAPPTGDMFPTLARRAAFPVHTCIVRKSLVEAVGRFDTSLRKSADWDLWQRVARTGARFGAVREVLAYYRMQPNSASLDAQQLLEDGLRVLAQGHTSDARVPCPHPDHAGGAPPVHLQSQKFYLLCWCAGLVLGSGKDARPLLETLQEDHSAELYADAVAQCIFEAATLPTCQPPPAWEALWPSIHIHVEEFLVALELQSRTPDLARRAGNHLKKLVLVHSATWSPVLAELEQGKALLEEQRRNWETVAKNREHAVEQLKISTRDLQQIARDREQTVEQLQVAIRDLEQIAKDREHTIEQLQVAIRDVEQIAKDRERTIEQLQIAIGDMERISSDREHAIEQLQVSTRDLQQIVIDREHKIEQLQVQVRDVERAAKDRLEKQRSELNQTIGSLAAKCDALLYSPERRIGDLLLNRLRFRSPLEAAVSLSSTVRHRLSLAHLAAEPRLAKYRNQHRILATICSNFPIYSHTFVYQELHELIRQGFALRLIYSRLDAREHLHSRFSDFWQFKRRLFLNRKVHERDFAHYRTRMPDKVERLVEMLCQASGLPRRALLTHDNFLQAFTFTRMAQAYRPHYLHSYFFYDRSLMALVAGWLLDIPRGISCYADHVLRDYELKVVPLHLELCDIVIATSQRIKQELLQIAPHADPNRILVKPNGIDTEYFPRMERSEPAQGGPFRIVCVCRIEPKKGLLDLVDAVHRLRQRGVPVEAHLVGAADDWNPASQDYKRRLDQRISELDLWGAVHLEGQQSLDGIRRFLGLAHLFVAPFVETESGDKDGIPTAVLEAMATGLPVVATNAGSIPEIIDDGHDGFLVPQRDPVALAAAIEALLCDSNRRQQMGTDGAQKVTASFDIRRCEKVLHERVRHVLKCRTP